MINKKLLVTQFKNYIKITYMLQSYEYFVRLKNMNNGFM